MHSQKRGLFAGLVLILVLAGMVGALTLGSGDGRQGEALYCAGLREFSFAASTLGSARDAQAQQNDPAIALRKFLAAQPAHHTPMPQTGWILLWERPGQRWFGHNRPGEAGTIDTVLVERHEQWGPEYLSLPRQGPWGVVTWGGCSLARFNPALHTAHWVILGPYPPPSATRFTAWVVTPSCFDGRPTPPEDIHNPEIDIRADAVTITFFAEVEQRGIYDCQERPRTAYEVTLSEPLGTRQLLDGGLYPPRAPDGSRPSR